MATILSTSAFTDEPSTSPIDNAPILGESPTIDNNTSLSPLLKKKGTLVATDYKEDIAKTAVADDILDEDKQVEEEQLEEEEEVDEEYVSMKDMPMEMDEL